MFVFVLFMEFNSYPILLTIGIVLIAALIAFLLRFYYPLGLEKRIDRVESFLIKQKRTPGLYINYVLANRLDDEAELVMKQIMQKYKREAAQAPFKAAYGVYCKDMIAVRKAVPDMRASDYRAYYETILLSEDGKSDQAREKLQSIKKQWMRSALLSDIELKAGHSEVALQYARDALNSSKGVHHYVLHKEYKRVLPQVFEPIS